MRRKNIKEKIKEYFFIHPTEKLRVRQLSSKTLLPLPSVIKYCKELEKEKILKTIKMENVVFYTANIECEEYKIEKKLFNIKSIYNSGLIEEIKENYGNPVIVLFGSYSKGEDIESSDIDLYVETSSEKDINLIKYEKKLNRKIELHKYKNIFDIKNKHLRNNIINGITLNGFLKVF